MPEKPSSDTEHLEHQRIKTLIDLFELGLDSEECIGYHGTSLETIEYLIEQGSLPGGVYERDESNPEGRFIYFFPIRSKFRDVLFHKNTPPEHKLFEEAAHYADYIAKGHYVLKRLGLDMIDPELRKMAWALAFNSQFDSDNLEETYKTFSQLGVSKDILHLTIVGAKNRKGVVLGFHADILHAFNPAPGDPGDFRIAIPNGLKLNFISGLEPMGQEEWDYLKKLQETFK